MLDKSDNVSKVAFESIGKLFQEFETKRMSRLAGDKLVDTEHSYKLQEDMKKQLSAEGNYTEEELEEYMQSHKKVMFDSLWKLNVADIEKVV
ncbi:hypothetical protein ACS0TY_001226 [Phlomoides rotata]